MIIMQRVVIQMSGYEVYQLPFASTLFIFDNPTSNLVQILYAYIPLPFVLFYFSGNAREITTGYGKLWLIRSYSRERPKAACVWNGTKRAFSTLGQRKRLV